MLPTLDARLAAAAELVRPGEPVADIGCDHGKLTAVLAASGRYPKVIGADLRPGPLAKAAQTLEHAGCKDLSLIHILSPLAPLPNTLRAASMPRMPAGLCRGASGLLSLIHI